MIDDDTIQIDTQAGTGTGGGRAARPRTYRARPRLSLEADPRAAGVLGGYLTHDPGGGPVFTWAAAPGVVVRWRGELRTAGLVLGLAAVLSPLLGLPAPWSVLLAAWLAWPAGAALWHAWLSGRLL